MRVCAMLFTAIIPLALACPVRAADDAAAIIDKAIAAQGGAEKLAKIKAEQWSSKGIVEVMGMKIEYTGNYSHQEPDCLRVEIEASFGGQSFSFASWTDGKSCWEKMGDKPQEMKDKKADSLRHTAYVMHLSRLLPLKERGITLSVTGEEKIGGKPAVGILVSAKGHGDVTMFFDKESNLLVKTLTETWQDMLNKNVSQETIFADFKEKEGHKLFGKLTIKLDGQPFIEEETSNQKLLDTKLDAKLFEKP